MVTWMPGVLASEYAFSQTADPVQGATGHMAYDPQRTSGGRCHASIHTGLCNTNFNIKLIAILYNLITLATALSEPVFQTSL
jgi:hypothetical protein